MNTNGKARAGGKGFDQNYFAGGKNKGFDILNFRGFYTQTQCKNCRSDYMKFHRDGFCQDCQQKAEFIYREKLAPAERLRFATNLSGNEVTV